jgi:hypothetical protein
MPKAGEIAQELRRIADALDKEPETELFVPELDFRCKYQGDKGKSIFLSLARIFPRPFAKGPQSFDDDALELRYTSDALIVTASIERSKVCRLIEKERIIPAVYDCEPLLSIDEETTLI